MNNKLIGTLVQMLTYCRPCGSTTERVFIKRYIETLPNAWMDEDNNWHVKVDDTPILWSCHTDTVHSLPGRQTLHYDQRFGIVTLSKRSKRRSSCLGADDTAGVFLMCQMIARKVPGYYLFHYGEEVGGIGSGDLARAYPEWLAQFQCAIALDRAGTKDVITHQFGGRTASTAFAESLAVALDMDCSPDSSGVYTDTYEYADNIAECTNLSIGYSHAHSKHEELDCKHVLRLLDALCNVRLDQLVIARTPGDRSTKWTVASSRAWPYDHIDDSAYDSLDKPVIIRESGWSMRGICKYCGNRCELDIEVCDECQEDCILAQSDRSDLDVPIWTRPEDRRLLGLDEDICKNVCRHMDGRCYHDGYLPMPIIDVELADDDEDIDPKMYLDPVHADVQAALRRRTH